MSETRPAKLEPGVTLSAPPAEATGRTRRMGFGGLGYTAPPSELGLEWSAEEFGV